MSEVVDETAAATRGREVLVRTFAVAEQQLDGRTLHVRVVPFGEVATVADPPDYKPYREQFMPGVFAGQENAAHRIRLRSDHAAIDDRTGQRKPGTAGIVGNGIAIVEANGGVEGEFRFLDTPDAHTAMELVREGGYDGVSQEFIPIKTVLSRDGVKQRVKAHLDSVALAVGPAYTGAEILALRESPEEVVIDESLTIPPIDRQLLERCADLGIELPESQALLLARAYTEVAWDGSASRWDTAEAYCAASAIDLNQPGVSKSKDLCHLPYKEPGGVINVNGVRAALSRIGEGMPVDATPSERDAAKATLERILNAFNSQAS